MTNELFELATPNVAHTKRFLEVWAADPKFRSELAEDADAAYHRRNLRIHPSDLEAFWKYREDVTFATVNESTPGFDAPLVQEYLNFRNVKLKHVTRVRRESAPADSRFRAWRERQILRTRTSLHPYLYDAIVHPVFACELSLGCSIGCWFCGVNAPKLDGHFHHNAENSRMWREVLGAIGEVAGIDAAAHGFLYWATDPFDNPDYEKFCGDFRDVYGIYPHTTTAQPLRDAERVRRLLRAAEEGGCPHNRFSILTLKLLERVHAEFTPEENVFVEMVLQNKGSITSKWTSGKARERSGNTELLGREAPEDGVDSGTIACVSGFLLNMRQRLVKLISPCNASERWPLGYYVYDEATFADGAEFRHCIDAMIERHMYESVRADDVIALRRDLAYEALDDGFRAAARFGRQTFNGNPFFDELGELVHAGSHTAGEIGHYFGERYNIAPDITSGWLDRLLSAGVLDDEPKPVADPAVA